MNQAVLTPSIIDVEASGFGAHSYPIEIGVVRNDGQRYCRLLKPFDDWCFWESSAQQVHGISRQQLFECGIDGVTMCRELNEFLGDTTVYSDGWVVDSPWVVSLYERASANMSFHISPLEMILSEPQMQKWHDTKHRVIDQLKLTRHRASNDALIIQQTYCITRNVL
ncbi:MAG: hypothetical protein WA981_06650 [Glaciecola sp.]